MIKINIKGAVAFFNSLYKKCWKEFLLDYADEDLRALGDRVIMETLEKMPNEEFKAKIRENLKLIESGVRDINV